MDGLFRFTSDGSTLVGAATLPIAGNNYRLEFWNVVQLKLIKLAAGHKGWITGLANSPDGKTVATSSTDTSIRLWDIPHRTRYSTDGRTTEPMSASPTLTLRPTGY